MPRPLKRGRPLPARAGRAPPKSPSTEPIDNPNVTDDKRGEGRGRSRTTRASGQLTLDEDSAIRAADKSKAAALERLVNEDATTSDNVAGDEESASPVGKGKRVMETPAHRQDTTGLDLAEDSIFGDLGDSFADGDVPDGSLSTDTTALSLSNFKSRSRQSSFIGRNDPPIRPSSRGGTTPGIGSSFNIGMFRRRAREPSILGTARKPMEEPSQDAHVSETESEDDFEPEAESTPMQNRRKTRHSEDIIPQSSLAQPEDAEPGLDGETAPASSNTKKRKSDDAHTSLRPDKAARTDADEGLADDSDSELSDAPPPPPPDVDMDSDSELSEISSPLEPPGFMARPRTPINMEEITAPPASSDSEGPDIWPDIRTLAKKRRRPSITTPTRPDNLSDISSPPSLTHSPNYGDKARARARPASRQQASPKVTTADLTNLLPKRRYKKARDSSGLESDEELDATELGDEDDELSHLDARAARKRKGRGPASRAGQASASARKSKQAATSHRSSDKENENDTEGDENDQEEEDEDEASRFVPLADDTFDAGAENLTPDVLSADELKQATKKFNEVDKWQLDFEEVTEESSPPDAR